MRAPLSILLLLFLALPAAALDTFTVTRPWHYHPGDPGDHPAWASPGFDDSRWAEAGPQLFWSERPPSAWPGIGWFRLRFRIDPAWRDRPLALFYEIRGAAEVYLDGRLVGRFGRVGTTEGEERAVFEDSSVPVALGPGTEHVLAVRVSCFDLEALDRLEGRWGGISVGLDEPEPRGRADAEELRRQTAEQMFFTGVYGSFALIHLVLFAFYPRQRENFWFAVFTALFAAATFLDFQKEFAAPLATHLALHWARRFVLLAVVLSGLRFVYSLVYSRLPRWFPWIAVAAGVLALAGLFLPSLLFGPVDAFAALGLVEMFRSSAAALRDPESRSPARLLFTGTLLSILGAGYDMLLDMDVLEPVGGVVNAYFYGVLGLLAFASISLGSGIARTNQQLRARERQAQEMEEARRLQLALLPSQPPELPWLEIAVAMETATEVGGDFYDFMVLPGGALTVVVGDATGHGMQAGMMVTAMKGLFHGAPAGESPAAALARFNTAIRGMKLGRLHMALAFAVFEEGRLRLASAGMPPVLHRRVGSERVEELTRGGVPLGAMRAPAYTESEIPLTPGDVVLFLSDGFPELTGRDGELLGYERATALFATASGPPADVIAELRRAAREWTGGADPDDDVTFVAVRVREGR